MGDGHTKPRVLVVDDEPDLVDLYGATLADDYAVEVAYGGAEALDLIEAEPEFDVALIDRRMPDVSGDGVLDRLHAVSPDCRVAMITAVEPDFDVVDMPFDEYLVKPISRSSVRDAVERLLRLRSYHERCREEYAVATKLAALRSNKPPEVLAESEEYAELVERLDRVRARLDATAADFETTDFLVAFSDISETPVPPPRSD